jgi:hypothetical protein
MRYLISPLEGRLERPGNPRGILALDGTCWVEFKFNLLQKKLSSNYQYFRIIGK